MKHNALTKYVRDSFQELTKVTWPTKNQAIRITAIVLVFTLVFAAFLGILDYIFGTGYLLLINLVS